jgi:hypothetical protein
MARLMTAARLGVVVLLAIAILGAVGTYSFRDVSAAGRAGAAKVPTLFQGNGHGGGNGNGNGGGNNGNGHGNGNAGQGTQQDDDGGDDADQGKGHGKKAKKDKAEKKNKAEDQSDDSGTPTADEDADSHKTHKNPQAGNVDCNDVDAMIEYLMNRNMNGALHANENGADNAAAGALNKCMDHGPQNGSVDDEQGTPEAEDATPEAEDGTPEAESGTPIADDGEDGSDKPVSVTVDIDADGNGTIEYDLDGDGEPDLTMIVKDGKVVEYVEAGADNATPEAA